MRKYDLDLITKWKNKKVFEAENERFKRKIFIHPSWSEVNSYDMNSYSSYLYLFTDVYNRYFKMNGDNVMMSIGFNEYSNKSIAFSRKHHQTSKALYNQYTRSLDMLGCGYDRKKSLSLSQTNVISFYQTQFLKMMDTICELKSGKVYMDKDFKRIYNSYEIKFENNKAYSIESDEELYLKDQEYIAINLEPYFKDIKQIIKSSNLSIAEKESLYKMLGEYTYLGMTFSNYRENIHLDVDVVNPELLAGISFITLNPDLMDVSRYILESEKELVESYLKNGLSQGVYCGHTVKNPLTGEDILIFISYEFKESIHLGIPSLNQKDLAFAKELGLDFKEVIEDGYIINSDFLDGYSQLEAKAKIIGAFTSEGIGEIKTRFRVTQLIVSNPTNCGIPIPIMRNKTNYLIEGIKENHIPVSYDNRGKLKYTNEDKLPQYLDSINMVFNQTFILGLSHLCAYEVENEMRMLQKSFKGETIYFINKLNLFNEFLLPKVFERILGIDNKDIFVKVDSPNIDDDVCNDYNLIRLSFVEDLLKDNNSDSYRMAILSKDFYPSFEATKKNLLKYDKFIEKIKAIYKNGFGMENMYVDIALQNLTIKVNNALYEYDLDSYIKYLVDFSVDIEDEVMTEYQALQYLKLLSIIIPFTTEEIFETIFEQSYFLVYEGWPVIK